MGEQTCGRGCTPADVKGLGPQQFAFPDPFTPCPSASSPGIAADRLEVHKAHESEKGSRLP